jgi:predicted MFS family arabinose efflux permease
MVIPFLTLYLTENLNFTLKNAAWVMSCFGLGSVVGSWIGGKLTDKFGYYQVMKTSLFLTGIVFIGLQFVTSFVGICLGIFLVMLVADAFRPALFVALNAYSKPENKTRSVTLIRLAINLGFTVGPAVGGVIITYFGYNSIFWIDGVTCILATFLLVKVLHPKKVNVLDEIKTENPKSIFTDKAFWIFFVTMFIFGFVFLQIISTIPLYYRKEYFLTEFQIGLLMAGNGFLIFILEMPLIKWLEDKKIDKISLILLGVVLTGISFLLFNVTLSIWILIISMVFISVGEMIVFPFSNSFAIERGKRGKQGEYMAYYSIAFSISHIFSHNLGIQMIAKYGFKFTWNFITILAFVGIFSLFILMRVLKKEAI